MVKAVGDVRGKGGCSKDVTGVKNNTIFRAHQTDHSIKTPVRRESYDQFGKCLLRPKEILVVFGIYEAGVRNDVIGLENVLP